jgi:DNA-binding response OmpR family regulator
VAPDVPAAASLRLLVVDDDVVVAMLLAMGLEDVEVVEASRATEGLQRAQASPPDAVIVDRTLPDGDGLDLVRSLRAGASTAELPIVVVTAGHDPMLRANVLRAGADDYLPKPVDPGALAELVRALVRTPPGERRRARERAARALPLRATVASSTPEAEQAT